MPKMNRLNVLQIILRALEGKMLDTDDPKLSPEEALEILRKVMDEDFGYDAKAWQSWIDNLDADFDVLLRAMKEEQQDSDPYKFTPTQALKLLKRRTRQDFGYDVQAWEKWIGDM